MPDLHVPLAVLMEALSAPEREAWERALAAAPPAPALLPVDPGGADEGDTFMAAMMRALFEDEQRAWQAATPRLARAA